MTKIHAISFAVCIFGTVFAFAADNKTDLPADLQTFRLWQHAAPAAQGNSEKDIPTLTAALPPASKNDGSVFIVCPGGGYQYLSDHEGLPVARWLNSHGITCFVLKYRLGPKYHHPAEMDDVQRAIRLVRFNAKVWGLDSKRIGIIGFSAGGHLASTAATHFDDGKPDAPDEIDRVSCRPDLAILVYPVITMLDPYVHQGSRKNLLGENPDPKLEELLSNDRQVTRQTPPCFLVTSFDDKTVPVENSLLFAEACHKHGVKVELHIFEHGRHGFGLGGDDPVLKTWPDIAAGWLAKHEFTNLKPAQ
jgi:acetyl esterase/lipase